MAQYELNLRDYLRVFQKRKIIIFLCFILFLLLGWHYGSDQVPIYEATASVKIEERRTIAGLLTEWIAYSPGDTMQTQANIITGFPTMKKVALRLELIGENSPDTILNGVVTSLRSKVRASRIGSTNIIEITATSPESQKAVDLANTVAQVYIEINLLEKNKQARTVRSFIENQLAAVMARLRDNEEKLKSFEKTIHDLEAAEALQDNLQGLEFQLANLLKKYTDKHPRVVQAKDQIAETRKRVKGFSGDQMEYIQIRRETEVNRGLYAMLKERLEQARINEAEKIGDVSILNPAIGPSSPINPQTNMGVLLGGLMGIILGCILAFVGETLDTSLGTIEDVENATGLPVLGIIPSIEHEFEKKGLLNNIFGNKKDKHKDERFVRLIVHYKPNSPAAESFRNIRTNLRIDGKTRKSILVTSSHPEEGKTVTAINLALVTAQGGSKTLLISSDLRRPVLARTFGLDKKPGITEVLSGAASLNEAMRNITDIMLGEMEFNEVMRSAELGNLWILPAGTPPVNPAELLVSRRMQELVAGFRKEFDVIFFDSPPILPVTDAAILANMADVVVLCYEFGRTSRDAIMRAKAQLESLNANIAGVILNHIKPQTEIVEPYPYYRYKYKKYGYYAPIEKKEKVRST